MGVTFTQVRASGGGARSPLWRQIQADVTREAQHIINVDEGPALGVALLAGVGTGVWSSVEEACDAVIRVEQSTEPIAANAALYDRYYEVYQALYRKLRDQMDVVAGLAGA
jgi:xylulokinase